MKAVIILALFLSACSPVNHPEQEQLDTCDGMCRRSQQMINLFLALTAFAGPLTADKASALAKKANQAKHIDQDIAKRIKDAAKNGLYGVRVSLSGDCGDLGYLKDQGYRILDHGCGCGGTECNCDCEIRWDVK